MQIYLIGVRDGGIIKSFCLGGFFLVIVLKHLRVSLTHLLPSYYSQTRTKTLHICKTTAFWFFWPCMPSVLVIFLLYADDTHLYFVFKDSN